MFVNHKLFTKADFDMATIGSRIKELRHIHHLTQSEFGELFGIVKSTVSSYEHGNSTPDDDIKKAICKHFGVTMDYLVGISESEKKADTDGLPLTEQQQKLFDAASDLPDDDIKQALDYIELLKLKRNQKPE